MKRFAACAALLLMVCACDSLPDWLGGSNDKPKLPGKRIDVLSEINPLRSDDTLGNVPVTLPEIRTNENWRQAAGSPQGLSGNLAFSGFDHHEKIRIGDSNSWDQPLVSVPVIAAGMVFAMDAKGYITAHDAAGEGKAKWENKSAVTEDESDILGGGLAFDNGRLYITSGRGKIVAIDATTGTEIWKQAVGVPLRAAPKAAGHKVYVISVDNQIFALSADKGIISWNQRGINENAEFLAAISPAVAETSVIAPYSSGEIHALDPSSGQEQWNDNVLKSTHTIATARFSGIGGNPVIKDDTVYVAGSNGYFAAFALSSGRRLWQQELSSLNTPWIGDDFIYVLSSANNLVCMQRSDGRIKWVKQLPLFKNEEKRKDPYFWHGPVMAGGNLLVAGEHGQLLALSPKNGSTVMTVEIPEGITHPPIVAGGRLYLLAKNARLHIYY